MGKWEWCPGRCREGRAEQQKKKKKKSDVVMAQRKLMLKHLESVLDALGGKRRLQFKPKKWA